MGVWRKEPWEQVPSENWGDLDETPTEMGFPVYLRRSTLYAMFLCTAALVTFIVRLIQGANVSGDVTLLAAGLLFGVGGWRILIGGIAVDGDSVVVRNIFITRRVALRDIQGVEPRTAHAAREQRGNRRRVYLITSQGSIQVDALQAGSPEARARNAVRLERFLHP